MCVCVWGGGVEGGGVAGERFKLGAFLYQKCKHCINELIFLHRVNNIKHNIKQNI